MRFVGPSYELKKRKADVQRSVNLMPTPVESGDGKSNFFLKPVPGLLTFSATADVHGGAEPPYEPVPNPVPDPVPGPDESTDRFIVPTEAIDSTVSIASDAVTVTEVPELEHLRLYPWDLDGEGKPEHSLGDTYYEGGSMQGNTPSTSFTTTAEGQAANYSDFYGPEPGRSSDNFAGTGWWWSSLNETLNLLNGASFVSTWPNDPAPPDGTDAQSMTILAAAYTVEYGPFSPTSVHPGTMLPTHTHVVVADWAQPSVWPERYMFLWNHGLWWGVGGYTPPAGYGLIPYSSGLVVGDGFYTNWPSYLLEVDATRLPHHPLTTEGKTWEIVTVGAGSPQRCKQLAAVEYRAGYLYQNALGPVIAPDDPRFNNDDYWDALRAAAMILGHMKSDVSYPVLVTSWALRTS